jgi:hypothetical protein
LQRTVKIQLWHWKSEERMLSMCRQCERSCQQRILVKKKKGRAAGIVRGWVSRRHCERELSRRQTM